MKRIKCATFNKEMQDAIPKEIKEKMKRNRDNAEKEQENKAKTLPIQNVINCPLCSGEMAFVHPENCMTEGCPNCVF